MSVLRALLVAWLALCSTALWAFDAAGSKTITAHLRDGSTRVLGQVHFSPGTAGQLEFAIRWDSKPFTDYFLSMREFKCLGGPDEIACLVPYPHKQPLAVKPGDWSWLEHNLMFMFKQPSEFGAKLWNGMYFVLRERGNALVGTPMSVDLNQIAAPPERTDRPPFDPTQRSEMDRSPRWLQEIVIQ